MPVSDNRAIYIRSDNEFTIKQHNDPAEYILGPLDRKLPAILSIAASQLDIPPHTSRQFAVNGADVFVIRDKEGYTVTGSANGAGHDRFRDLINDITNRFLSARYTSLQRILKFSMKEIISYFNSDALIIMTRNNDDMFTVHYQYSSDTLAEPRQTIRFSAALEDELLSGNIVSLNTGNDIKSDSWDTGKLQPPLNLIPLIYRRKLFAVFILSGSSIVLPDASGDEMKFIAKLLFNLIDNKKAHAALKRSSERYSIVTKQTGHIIYDYNFKTGKTDWFGNIYRLTGYSKKTFPDYYREHFKELIHPDDYEGLVSSMREIMDKQGRYSLNYRIRHKKGKYRYIHDEGIVIYDNQSRPHHMIGTMKDTTETIENRRKLIEREKRYREFVKNSNEGIWRVVFREDIPTDLPASKQSKMIRKHGYIAECNEVCARMYGFESTDQMIGKPIDFFTDSSYRQETDSEEKQAGFVENGYKSTNYITKEKDSRGRVKYFLNSALGIAENGYLKSIWGTQQDITERIEAEMQLKENQRQMDVLMSNLPGMVYSSPYSDHYSFDFISSACEDITGYRPDELTGNPVYGSMIEDKFKEMIERSVKQSFDENKKFKIEYRIRRRDGEVRWMSERGVVIKKSNKNHAIEGFIIDITEQKSAEQKAKLQEKQLRQADKMATLGTLVSGVAHEINNPNNYIMLNGKVIRDVWDDVEKLLDQFIKDKESVTIAGLEYPQLKSRMPKLINGINDGTQRIKSIVSNLKNFSKSDSDDSFSMCNINLIIESAVMIVRNIIKRSTDSFDVQLSEDIPEIACSSQQIEQVIINLLTNACDAVSENRGSISIESSCEDDTVTVKVRDNGKGMSEGIASHIFDPFFTTKRNTGGTGLGLSISYNIIEKHNGRINVMSRPGEGTTVILEIPVNKEE